MENDKKYIIFPWIESKYWGVVLNSGLIWVNLVTILAWILEEYS